MKNLLLIACLAALASEGAAGKCAYVSLADLVRESDVIALGTFTPEAPGHWWSTSLSVEEVLKGEHDVLGQELKVCSGGCPDAPDFKTLAGHYLVFLSKHRDCLILVHGYISVVRVIGDQANTAALEDQPEHEKTSDLLAKVRSLTGR